MSNILWLKDLAKNDVHIAGGKAANLGELMNAGYTVPNGFVITTKAWKEFIVMADIKDRIFSLLRSCNPEDTKNLIKISETIQDLIINQKIDEDLQKEIIDSFNKLNSKFVAVRSSATTEDLPTASFAGQQATILNANQKKLLESIKKCWASLFTPRAITYRARHDFQHEKSLIAVVIQKMVQSQKSGVMFTLNPVNNSPDEIIIEGTFGLGEAVVSGEITPDSFIVDKETMEIKNMNISKKEWGYFKNKEGKTVKEKIPQPDAICLTETELDMLGKLGRSIEKHYEYPQDIEWAIEEGNIYVLQSRPVTTVK